jgi:hypothetical protein
VRHLFARCLVVAALGLGPSCHCCIPGLSNVSFRTSVLFGFHLQMYSWSVSPVVLVRPTVPPDFVSCAVPLLHSELSFRRRRTLFAVHTFPGSEFSWASVPYAIAAFRAFPTSNPGRPSFRSSRCYIVLVVSLAIVSPALCHFCTVHHLCVRRPIPRFATCLDPNFPDEVSLSPCHFRTAEHHPAGGADFLLDPLIPGLFPSFSGGAPRPDCRPYAASSVLRPSSLRRLPWGSPDAPLWTASFLDWVQSPSLRCRR